MNDASEGVTQGRSAVSRVSPDKLGYIDAVRGWAILLVITAHTGSRFPELPYPVKKLTNFGWHGVQLFFIASAVTLMLSWSRRTEAFPAATRHFFIRRFLRIAPMYYAGALLYFLVDGIPGEFSLAQLLRSLLFVNAWHPEWLPTTKAWSVVPGGWSIGVEFTFYALFPLLASLLTNARRAAIFFAAALPFAVLANNGAAAGWLRDYEVQAARNFLYFWFPNQLPVFAAGILLFYLLRQGPASVSRGTSLALGGAAVLFCIYIAGLALGISYLRNFTDPPPIFWATLAFMVFVYALAKGPATWFTHPWVQRVGVLSFSAYVLHFLFIQDLPAWSGGLIDVNATGLKAIGMFVLLWVGVVACTLATASLAHRYIERPGMALAARWIAARRSARPAPPDKLAVRE